MMIEKIKSGLSTSLVKNTLKLSSSNIILYFLPLIVTPILSRLYTPDYFGAWGIFASSFSIISVIMFGSYDNAIIKAPEKDVHPLCKLCLLSGLASSILTLIVFYLGKVMELDFFSTFPNYWLLFSILLIQVFTVIFTNLLNKYNHYNIIAFANLINGGSQGALRIVWRLITRIGNGLIIGTVLANLVNLFYLLLKSKSLKVFSSSIREVRDVAIRYKNFPLYDAPALLLQFAALNLPIIILSFYFSRSEIGCYSLIVQLLILPISFIGSAMGKVYYQQLSSCEEGCQTQEIRHATLLVFKILGFICALPCLFIGLGGDSVIVWFLGKDWTSAGNMAICMALWSIPTILTESFKPLFRIKDKQRFLLLIEGLYFILGIGILLCGCLLNWNLYIIILTYSLICAIVKLLALFEIFKLSNTSFNLLPLFSRLLIWGSIIIISVRIINILFDA